MECLPYQLSGFSNNHYGDLLTKVVWSQFVHPGLPKLVKQSYGTELRSCTLTSIKPEISQVLNSFWKTMNPQTEHLHHHNTDTRDLTRHQRPDQTHQRKVCPLCCQEKRPRFDCYLSMGTYLPDAGRWCIIRAHQITDSLDGKSTECAKLLEEIHIIKETSIILGHVKTEQTLYLDMFISNQPIKVIIDSEATGNMIWHTAARHLGVRILNCTQSVRQGDGSSPLSIVGKTRFTLERECIVSL